MQLRTFTEPQFGATYDDLLAVAQATEAGGFDAFFRSDHFLTMGGDGLPGPTDAWLTLAGLARETSRIRLGTLVTSATFRLPGPLAASVAQVSHDVGRPCRARPRLRVVRAGAHGVRRAVPPARRTVRATGGATGDHHRACGTTPVGDLFTHQGKHYSLTRQPGAAQAGRSGADHRRRLGDRAHTAAGGPVRERVQRAVRLGRRYPSRLRPGTGSSRPVSSSSTRPLRSSRAGGTQQRSSAASGSPAAIRRSPVRTGCSVRPTR